MKARTVAGGRGRSACYVLRDPGSELRKGGSWRSRTQIVDGMQSPSGDCVAGHISVTASGTRRRTLDAPITFIPQPISQPVLTHARYHIQSTYQLCYYRQ